MIHAFLSSELDEDEWWASRPGRFIPEERTPHLLTHWVDSRTALDVVVKRNFSVLLGI